MTIRSFKYVEIARLQLQTAVELFLSETNYISAITLAGAAEEIFGKMTKPIGKKNALAQRMELAESLNEIFTEFKPLSKDDVIKGATRDRNRVKHLDHPKVAGVIFDDKEAAEDLIERAIENYEILGQPLSLEMRRFRTITQNAV